MREYDILSNVVGQCKLSDQHYSFKSSRDDTQNLSVQGWKSDSFEQVNLSVSFCGIETMPDLHLRELVLDMNNDSMTKLGNISDDQSSLCTSIGKLPKNLERDTYVSRKQRSPSSEREQANSSAKSQNGEVSHVTENRSKSARYWQVVAIISCFLANLFTGGVTNSYGVLYIYMQDSLGVSEYQLSWIGSLMGGFHGIMAILGTVLVDTIGCRLTTLIGGLILSSSMIISSQTSNLYILYITLGVLPGVGTILSYLAAMVHLSWMFSKWLPMVTGLSVTGFAVGILIWPLITSGLADTMGWRGALLIQAAVLLHLLPAALLIKPKVTKGLSVSKKRGDQSIYHSIANFFKVFKLPGAISFCIGPFFSGLGYYTFSTFTPEYALTSLPDILTSEASLIISLVGFGSMVGRLTFSLLVAVSPNTVLPIYIISFFLCGLINIAVTLCYTVRDFFITGFFYGLASGGFAGVISLVLAKQFGIEHLSKMIGIFIMMEGVGAICGPPLLSYLAAVMGQKMIFYLTGSFFAFSVLVTMPLLFNRKSLSRKHKYSTKSVFTVDGQQNDPNIKSEHLP